MCVLSCCRLWDVIRVLHRKIVAGRHRFGKYVTHHFAELLASATLTWREFLLDGGKGKAPDEYLRLVEVGLRSFGSDIHAMGSKAMASQAKWAAVSVWRKREAYIALCRHVLGRTGYPQWDCFSFRDFTERQMAADTFYKRHLPLSDGVHDFGGKLPAPASWSVSEPPKKRRRRTTAGSSNDDDGISAAAATATSTHTGPTMWDVEKNCLVPFE